MFFDTCVCKKRDINILYMYVDILYMYVDILTDVDTYLLK